MSKSKKIAIVHYRVGRTDGVSFEIDKRKCILQRLGHEVKLISGPVQSGADFVIDELEFDSTQIRAIKENSFKYFGKLDYTPSDLINRIYFVAAKIEEAFLKYHENQKFDLILLHNIFSHGRHIAAASAFANLIQKLHIPVIATHHDCYWEREEYQEPSNNEIKKYLEIFVPPYLKWVTHISISSIAQSQLWEKRGIKSVVFPDIFDFKQRAWQTDEYNSDFLTRVGVKPRDLVILQATRIVERKGIEIAIHFVKELEKYKRKVVGKKLYNGKMLAGDSAFVFVLAGYAEESAQNYLIKIKKQIKESGIEAKFIHSLIAAKRSEVNNEKVYSLWDAYVHADLVTYPSLSEGWGNQFIEAVFAKKPIVLFEYPVFKADIKKEGYDYISFGDKIDGVTDSGLVTLSNRNMEKAVKNTIQIMTSKTTVEQLKGNIRIGEKYHGFSILQNFLRKAISK